MMQFEDRKAAPCWEVDEDRRAGALDCIIPKLQPDSVDLHQTLEPIFAQRLALEGMYCLLTLHPSLMTSADGGEIRIERSLKGWDNSESVDLPSAPVGGGGETEDMLSNSPGSNL